MEALLGASHSIIKHKKSFQDGEMIKEASLRQLTPCFGILKTNQK